jgi:hypothetical protein
MDGACVDLLCSLDFLNVGKLEFIAHALATLLIT